MNSPSRYKTHIINTQIHILIQVYVQPKVYCKEIVFQEHGFGCQSDYQINVSKDYIFFQTTPSLPPATCVDIVTILTVLKNPDHILE